MTHSIIAIPRLLWSALECASLRFWFRCWPGPAKLQFEDAFMYDQIGDGWRWGRKDGQNEANKVQIDEMVLGETLIFLW